MKTAITKYLENLEDISILFAVASGSRLWGMSSENSDYDIRFVYYRQKNEYLSLFNQYSETIDQFIISDGIELDFVGWDIFKFLRLLGKSNPATLEWIRSSQIYQDNEILNELRVISNSFSRFSLFMHHLSMANDNYQKYIADMPKPTLKSYLYVIRSILSAIYIIETLEFPPLDIEELLQSTSSLHGWNVNIIADPVRELLNEKKSMKEEDRITVDPSLKFWISDILDQLSESKELIRDKNKGREIDKDLLEQILVEVLN